MKESLERLLNPSSDHYLNTLKSIVIGMTHSSMCLYFGIFDQWNLQYFNPGGGYRNHIVVHGDEGYKESRVLVWMFYLNNVKSGTKFLTSLELSRNKKGRLVMIFPFMSLSDSCSCGCDTQP